MLIRVVGLVVLLCGVVGGSTVAANAPAPQEWQPVVLDPPEGVKLYKATFTPDGRGVVAAGWSKKWPTVLYAWDLKTRQRRQIGYLPDKYAGAYTLYGLDWSPDGRLIVIWATDVLDQAIWVDPATGEVTAMLGSRGYAEYADDKPAKEVMFAGKLDFMVSVLSPGGRELIGLTRPTKGPADLIRYDFRTGRVLGRKPAEGSGPDLPATDYPPGYSPEASRLAVAEQGLDVGSTERVWVWDVKSGKSIQPFKYVPDGSDRGTDHKAVFSRTGKYLATHIRRSSIYFWDLEAGEQILPDSTGRGKGSVVPCHTSDRFVAVTRHLSWKNTRVFIYDPAKGDVTDVMHLPSGKSGGTPVVSRDDRRILLQTMDRILVLRLPRD